MSRRKRHNIPSRFGSWDDNWPRKECDPTYQLEAHIASLRDTDPARWQQLQAEWSNSEVSDV